MLAWLFADKHVPQGINWEDKLLEIHADVKTGKENSGHTKTALDTLTADFTKHCLDEAGDKVQLKNDICNKMAEQFANFKCPDTEQVKANKLKGEAHDGEIAEVKKKAKTCSDTVKGWKIVKEIKKSIWTSVRGILLITFLGMGAITGFISWILGWWG